MTTDSLTLERLGVALAVNLALGGAAFAAGKVSRSGWVGGTIVGTWLLWFGGWGAYLALVGFFILGTVATSIGYGRKAARGLAQEDEGRRGSKHAAANCATACVLATTVPFWPSSLPLLGIVGAFATALSDTLGSEIGQLYGKRPYLPTTFRRVPPGTEGAVSFEGTAAGVLGSFVLSLVGFAGGLYALSWVWLPVVGAFVGTTFESYVGAIWAQDAAENDLGASQKPRIGNETMNFLNTVVGAAAAMAVGWWIF